MNQEDFKAETKALVKKHSPHVSDEHIDLHSDSTYYWGPENYAQAGDWLRRTVAILSEPEKFSNADIFTNFFGVIADGELMNFLREKAVGSLSAAGYAEKDFPRVIEGIKDPETRLYFQLVWKAKNLLEPIQKQFSDDEKFLLRFLRHRYCHAKLDGFSVKIDGKAEDVKFKTANWEQLVRLSKATTVEDFRISLLKKLDPCKEALAEVARLFTPSGGERLFRE